MVQATNRPLEPDWVARRKFSCDELTATSSHLWWIQSDPDLAGAARVMCWSGSGQPAAVTPADVQVGSWLHAYGGGSFAVSDQKLWFINARDSGVWQLDMKSSERRRVVPAEDGFVYGDLRVHPARVLAVRESERIGDQIVEIDEAGQVRILIESTGLLSSPVASGPALAFVEWDVTCMPWDSSRLCLATLDGSGQVEQVVTVAGGPEESVAEPQWGPDGELYFLSDRTGWWNLHRWHQGDVQHVLAVDQDCGPAPWEAGYRSYTFLPDGTIIVTLHDGCSTWLASASSTSPVQRLDTGLTSVKPYVAAFGDRLAVIGSTPSSAPTVRLVDLVHGEPAATFLDSGRSSDRADHAVSIVSERETASAGATVRFLLRLPPATDRSALPLLVRAHPGPTDEVPLRLDWSAEFFTSRGFAVADVAYRGSSGQGRAFRQVLYGHWGEFDVQDCAAVAEHLLAEGVARPGAVFISGASAGGYTALKAACRPGPFTAATAISAIIDPHRWQTTAPRFQRPYAALLAGPAGPVRAQQAAIPVLLIHGTNDAVAPVDDARQLAAELREHGKEHVSLFLEGAGHYLSEPQSQEAALSAEARFYVRFIDQRR